MTIMHVFTTADSSVFTPGVTQLRYHECVPWDEAYDLYLDPTALDALLALARAAAQGRGGGRMRGRVFDVLRTVREAQPMPSLRNRDGGPFVAVTGSSTLHRIELEQLIATWDARDWAQARELGDKLNRLLGGVAEDI